MNMSDIVAKVVTLGRWCSPMKVVYLLRKEGIEIDEGHVTSILLESGIPLLDVEGRMDVLDEEQTKLKISADSPNEMNIESDSNVVKSVDDLIAAASINTEEWIITHSRVKSYTTAMKVRNPDGSDTARVVTNYAVSCRLLKRNPDQLKWDPIAPVTLEHPMARHTSRSSSSDTEKVLVVPDTHIGFSISSRDGRLTPVHSRSCLDTILSVASDVQFDRVVFVGDVLDMAEWSTRWVTSRDMMFTTQAALVEALWWFAQFRKALPSAEIVVVEGNHDARLMKSVQKNHMAAAGLRPADDMAGPEIMSMERLLGLDSVDVQYYGGYPDNAYYITESLRVVHGHGGGGDPYKLLMKRVASIGVSEICGHIHKLAMVYKTDWGMSDYSTRYVASCGCAVDLGGPIPKNGEWGSYNWQNGFATVLLSKSSGRHETRLHEVYGGTECMYGDKLYTGIDRGVDIYEDTGYHGLRYSYDD